MKREARQFFIVRSNSRSDKNFTIESADSSDPNFSTSYLEIHKNCFFFLAFLCRKKWEKVQLVEENALSDNTIILRSLTQL